MPYIDRIVLTVIPEDGVAQAAMETGEIISTGLTADTADKFINDPNYKVVINKNATNVSFLEFNFKVPPCNDVNFRKAMHMQLTGKPLFKQLLGDMVILL